MSHFLFYPENEEVRYFISLLCIFVTLNRVIILNILVLFLIVFIILFFRNPVYNARRFSFSANVLTSPSYGKVTNIHHGLETRVVSIFLSIFDPHGQYSPCHGTIQNVQYFPGTFHPAQLYTKTKDNERCVTTFKTPDGDFIHVTQIAGFLARRIIRFCEIGDILHRAWPFGMIRFGSRVDIEVPIEYELLVQEGQNVCGPYTPLAQKTNNELKISVIES